MTDRRRGISRRRVGLASAMTWLALTLFALCPAAMAQDTEGIATLERMAEAFASVAEKASPAVVGIKAEWAVEQSVATAPGVPEDLFEFFFRRGQPEQQPQQRQRRQRAQGSGFIISRDGHILTNSHVVSQADRVRVDLRDGLTVDAEVVGTDPESDVAVIKVDSSDLPTLPLANSEDLKVGEWVLAIGSPLGLSHTVTAGIVSAKGRSGLRIASYENFIQTDAAINMGNSGGPLVNLNGELVGLNTAILSRSGGFQGIGFAVPSNMAMRIMNSLLTEGRVVRGWLGVSIQDITQNLAEAMNLERTTGALIGDVLEDSPADKAGFESGDVIIAMDNMEIRNSSHLRNQVAATLPDTEVNFEVIRGGRKVQIDAVLGERDAEIAQTGSDSNLEDKLGFAFETLTEDLAAKIGVSKNLSGVAVSDVQPGSSAFRAGLREGDVIREVDRSQVDNESEFIEAVNDKEAGDNILLRVHRQGNTIYLAFTL